MIKKIFHLSVDEKNHIGKALVWYRIKKFFSKVKKFRNLVGFSDVNSSSTFVMSLLLCQIHTGFYTIITFISSKFDHIFMCKLKKMNSYSLTMKLLQSSNSYKSAVYMHLTKADLETLLYLRCSSLGLYSVSDTETHK